MRTKQETDSESYSTGTAVIYKFALLSGLVYITKSHSLLCWSQGRQKGEENGKRKDLQGKHIMAFAEIRINHGCEGKGVLWHNKVFGIYPSVA